MIKVQHDRLISPGLPFTGFNNHDDATALVPFVFARVYHSSLQCLAGYNGKAI
jgi:hypothetical protein